MSAKTLTAGERRLSWTLQLVVATILAQTLYFKFTAAPESVYIFSTLGLEPVGAHRVGDRRAPGRGASARACPRSRFGALLALGVIAGAIASHLGPLGIEVLNDGGLLFGLACVVFVSSAAVLWLRRRELPIVGVRLS